MQKIFSFISSHQLIQRFTITWHIYATTEEPNTNNTNNYHYYNFKLPTLKQRFINCSSTISSQYEHHFQWFQVFLLFIQYLKQPWNDLLWPFTDRRVEPFNEPTSSTLHYQPQNRFKKNYKNLNTNWICNQLVKLTPLFGDSQNLRPGFSFVHEVITFNWFPHLHCVVGIDSPKALARVSLS